jgi:ABC-type nitrate/sulfonate/bicarbonate transport system substrate-binding protein
MAALWLAGCGSAAAPASPASSSNPASAAPPSAAAAPASASAKPAAPAKPAASGASGSPAAKPAASGLTHVKIAFTSKSTGGLYAYAARDLGIYQKHGLEAELVIGQSNALAPALLAGDIDFIGTMPSAIQAAEKDLPIRGVMVAKDHPEYLLVGDLGVSKVEQLKGKELVGSIPTQLPTQMMSQLLALDGLQPSDYTVIPVQDDTARAALVDQRRVAAGILGLSQAFPLVDKGHPIIDSTLEKVFNPSNGVATSLANMENKKDLVQRMVDASLEATKITSSDRAQTVSVLVKDFDQTEANAGRLFDLLIPSYTKNGRADPRGIKNQLEADAKAMQLPKVKAESDVYDWRFLPNQGN